MASAGVPSPEAREHQPSWGMTPRPLLDLDLPGSAATVPAHDVDRPTTAPAAASLGLVWVSFPGLQRTKTFDPSEEQSPMELGSLGTELERLQRIRTFDPWEEQSPMELGSLGTELERLRTFDP